MLFPLSCLPHGLSAPHPILSLIPSLVPISGWNLFTNKSNHGQDQGPHTLLLADVIAWLVGGKKGDIFKLLSF